MTVRNFMVHPAIKMEYKFVSCVMMMMAHNMRPDHFMAMKCKTDTEFAEKVYQL